MKKQNSYDDLNVSTNIPQWQQSIVLDRIENSTEFVDAFEMLAQLNPDSAFAQYYE
ncbi:hypothetical protein [Myroides sp.]|uniref:hypothetical protein n=1 Tax=Myroides sp. TaxID=1874736 RepID=UPI0028AFDD0A|nr:hypothetical protein [Myroides sp.]